MKRVSQAKIDASYRRAWYRRAWRVSQAEIDASYRAWYRRTWPRHVLAAPNPVYAAEPPPIDMITREALRLFSNSNDFLAITSKFDKEFEEAKRIRLPNDYARALTSPKPGRPRTRSRPTRLLSVQLIPCSDR